MEFSRTGKGGIGLVTGLQRLQSDPYRVTKREVILVGRNSIKSSSGSHEPEKRKVKTLRKKDLMGERSVCRRKKGNNK